MRSALFRAEALRPAGQGWMGEVVLVRPLSLRLVAWFAIASCAALAAFMCRAEFTRRVPGEGTLVPDAGLIRIQAPRAGVVLQRLVREGEHVRAGQVLYVITSELAYLPGDRPAAAAGVAQRTLETVRERRQLLGEESARQAAVARRERVALEARARGLRQELGQIDAELGVERERLAAREAQYERYRQAREDGFLSPLGLQQKYDEVLDQRARVQAMLRSRLGVERDMAAAAADLDAAADKTGLTLSQLQREELTVRREQAEHEATGHVAVAAPAAGTVGAVLAEPGQRVDADTLLTLVPDGSRLEAQLLLPSKAVGFVREGDPVDLKFGAFPNQAPGRVRGVVTQVSRTALGGQDLARQDWTVGGDGKGGRYRVRVRLPVQALEVDGALHPLRAGMDVSASFPQERRTLMRWMLQPLARLRERT